MQLDVNVPDALRAPVAAAVAWVNATREEAFELTGLVDAERALDAEAGQPFELGLVLCNGELCAREQVRIEPNDDGYRFSFAALDTSEIPPLLDPPVGVRQGWLAGALAKHEFVLLLFYRGLW